MQRSFHILTFGCQMNFNDSHWLEQTFLAHGFVQAPLDKATVIIVNTCSVREKPEQKVYNTLRKIRAESRNTAGAFAVVAGCVAQQIGSAFFEKFPWVRLVCGTDSIHHIPSGVEKLFAEPNLRLSLVDFSQSYPERDIITVANNANPLAYVNIMQGCDNFCAYCIVPFTRGRQKSRTLPSVLAECETLLEHGTREICLLGQNVNSFGQDKAGDGTSFAQLLLELSKLKGLERLRFMTPHPKDVSKEVIQSFGELEVLCPHVHLPMQSGSDSVLAKMGRKYSSAHFLSLVQALRSVRPDMSFSSDIIVGFPGESEEDFMQTCDMLEKVNFRASFSFCYSDRPGTQAQRLPMKIETEVMLERLHRLQEKQGELTAAWLKEREGEQTVLLLEDVSKKNAGDAQECYWQGRDPHGVTVNVALPEGLGKCGLLLPVQIINAKKNTLLAKQVGSPW